MSAYNIYSWIFNKSARKSRKCQHLFFLLKITKAVLLWVKLPSLNILCVQVLAWSTTEKYLLDLATNWMLYNVLSFGAETSLYFHTVGNSSHLLSLNRLCECLRAHVEWRRLGGESKGDTWTIVMFSSHSGQADKWANLLKTIFISLRSEIVLCTHLREEKKKSLPVHFYHTEKAPKASTTLRDQTALHKERHYWLLIAAQASHLLRQSHVCQPWQ